MVHYFCVFQVNLKSLKEHLANTLIKMHYMELPKTLHSGQISINHPQMGCSYLVGSVKYRFIEFFVNDYDSLHNLLSVRG